jgi:hypothetical protein
VSSNESEKKRRDCQQPAADNKNHGVKETHRNTPSTFAMTVGGT